MTKIPKLRPVQRIAFNQYLLSDSWGGANQFLKQLAPYLAERCFEITYELDPLVTHIFIIDVRPIVTCTFTIEEAQAFKKRFPNVKVIHRINNCDQKYTAEDLKVPGVGVDRQVVEMTQWVDRSVFISDWLKNYFLEKGFSQDHSSLTITNAADDDCFYPHQTSWKINEPMKIVTHHWSNNWLKGYKVYQEIDKMIDTGELPGFELTIVGRWPDEIQWKSAKTMAAMNGPALADELRKHHLYVTASQHEPGGMHFIEGMQCGLPVVFQKNGGGICEVACRAGIEFDTDIKTALLQAKMQYTELRGKVLKDAPSGEKLCEAFYRMIVEESKT
ncbi:MAG: glycosyltransferase [Verrucomicrobiota bacterium]